MKRSLHLIAIAAFMMVGMTSCLKDSEMSAHDFTELFLEIKTQDLNKFLIGNHFIPVEFYSDKPIDYNETNATVLAETNLNKYIINYVKDDVITFNADLSLPVIQNAIKMPGEAADVLNRSWSISSSKEKNEVYLMYLDYDYTPRQYTVVEFKDNYILMYVDWTSKADPSKTARLYSKFQKN